MASQWLIGQLGRTRPTSLYGVTLENMNEATEFVNRKDVKDRWKKGSVNHDSLPGEHRHSSEQSSRDRKRFVGRHFVDELAERAAARENGDPVPNHVRSVPGIPLFTAITGVKVTRTRLPAANYLEPSQGELSASSMAFDFLEHMRLQWMRKDLRRRKRPAAAKSASFKLSTRQKMTASLLRMQDGVLAVWGTGMGKTILSAAAASLMLYEGLVDRVVVVTPKRLQIQMADEMTKCGVPQLARLCIGHDDPAALVVTTHEKLYSLFQDALGLSQPRNMSFEDYAVKVEQAREKAFDFFGSALLIIDESQNMRTPPHIESGKLKGVTTLFYTFICNITRKRLLLSATPAPNDVEDICPQLSMAMGTTKIFSTDRNADESTRFDYLLHVWPPKKKKEADLDQETWQRMHGCQFVSFNQREADDKDFPSVRIDVFEVPTDSDATNVNSKESRQGFFQDASAASNKVKWQPAADLVVEAAKEGKQTLFFSDRVENGIDPVQKLTEKQEVACAKIDGNTGPGAASRILRDFENGRIRVLFLSIAAASEGLDFKKVRRVILLEEQWNFGRVEQAVGRAVRRHSHAELDPAQRDVHVTIMHVNSEAGKSLDDHRGEMSKSKARDINEMLDFFRTLDPVGPQNLSNPYDIVKLINFGEESEDEGEDEEDEGEEDGRRRPRRKKGQYETERKVKDDYRKVDFKTTASSSAGPAKSAAWKRPARRETKPERIAREQREAEEKRQREEKWKLAKQQRIAEKNERNRRELQKIEANKQREKEERQAREHQALEAKKASKMNAQRWAQKSPSGKSWAERELERTTQPKGNRPAFFSRPAAPVRAASASSVLQQVSPRPQQGHLASSSERSISAPPKRSTLPPPPPLKSPQPSRQPPQQHHLQQQAQQSSNHHQPPQQSSNHHQPPQHHRRQQRPPISYHRRQQQPSDSYHQPPNHHRQQQHSPNHHRQQPQRMEQQTNDERALLDEIEAIKNHYRRETDRRVHRINNTRRSSSARNEDIARVYADLSKRMHEDIYEAHLRWKNHRHNRRPRRH